MDHLRDQDFMEVTTTEDVEWVLKKQEQDIKALFRKRTFGHTDFVAFLEDRGWTADERTEFKLKKKDKKDSEKKPNNGKKTLDNKNGAPSEKNNATNTNSNPLPRYNIVEISQAWLFFALLVCILRKDKEPVQSKGPRTRSSGPVTPHVSLPYVTEPAPDQGGHTIPILTFEDLVDNNSLLTTKHLLAKLQIWQDCIKTTTPKAKLRSRLIEVDRTLQLARRVVRANMTIKWSGPHEDSSMFGQDMNGPSDDAKARATEASKAASESPLINNSSVLSFCIMVLGETLSAAKLQLMNDLGLRMNGWLVDDDDGWGPPSFIISKMEESWCPRASAVMQGQLGFSAILLSTAFQVRKKPTAGRTEHEKCNPRQCFHVPGVDNSEEKKIFYPPRHHPNKEGCKMHREGDCNLYGPDMQKLLEILKDATAATESASFPILRIVSTIKDSSEDGPVRRVKGVTVERWSLEPERDLRKPQFTAISHVWSQGMGNEKSNTLQECQLEFILTNLLAAEAGVEGNRDAKYAPRDKPYAEKLLKQVLGREYDPQDFANYDISPPFWMDTLAIPASPDKSQLDFKNLKARAIRQIYHVYNHATRVVVIDKDLCKELAPSTRPFHTILKVLSSAWMQRLWTLQEAFLSRNLLVAFWSNASDARFGGVHFELSGLIQVSLQNLDHLIKQLDRPQNSHTTAMAELIKRKLVNNLMGEDREIRNRNDHPIETRGSMVIASAWRSSRWRNTSRQEDETLALSTLLNLDYRDTKIEDNVKESAGKGSTLLPSSSDLGSESSAKLAEKERNEKLEGMMEAFWSLINKNYEGSIPAGLIFLPGDRLSGPGFGWAPKTWMSASDEIYPYPLGIPSKPTELHKEGLLVQYPGFLLQCGHPNRILGSNLAKSTLSFPIDQSMSEWYQVRPLEEARAEFDPARMMLSKSHATSHLEFGIILSRPKPREWPDEEIGLLVQIWREAWKRKEPERISRKYLYSQIVRHVLVSRRSTVPAERKHYQLPAGKLDDDPIGEAMPEDTLWYVDGYRQDRDQPRVVVPPSSTHWSPPETQNSVDAKASLEKKNAAFQTFTNNFVVRSLSFGRGSRNHSPELTKTPSFTTSHRGLPSVPSIPEKGGTPRVSLDGNEDEALDSPSPTEKTTPGGSSYTGSRWKLMGILGNTMKG